MRRIKKPLYILLLISFVFASCNSGQQKADETSLPDSLVKADYYTDLFDRTGEGFTGGDGTYSVELPDGSTAWIFGDTFIGGVNSDKTRRKETPMYIRNSIVVQDGDSLRTIYSTRDGQRASFVIPPVVLSGEQITEDSVWFWPGDAYIENDDLYLFLSEFSKIGNGMWDFQWEGTWLAIFELPGFVQKDIVNLPQGRKSGVHLGHAVYPAEDFTYIYGAKEGKPHVARYPAGNFRGKWEYYDGSGWNPDPESMKPMADISGSEQFSVFEMNDMYILLTQMGGLSDEICSFTSEKAFGPWNNKKLIYKTPISDTTKNLFTYNALAHPNLVKDNHLLVSYNMNSMELEDHFKNADIYRPRFIWVPLEKINPALVE